MTHNTSDRHHILRHIREIIQDWFAFYPKWFGINPIIWILYVAGILDLSPYFSGKLIELSTIFTVPVAIIGFILVFIGAIFRRSEIRTNFPNKDLNFLRIKVTMYVLFETLAVGFGLIFGTLGLWTAYVHDELVKNELIIMSLIVPNILSIVARAYVRESVIARYFLHAIGR